MWLIFFSTLCIYPVYQLGIKKSENFFIGDNWYQDVVTFLTFNIMVTIGNILPKTKRTNFLPHAVISRALLVFCFFSLTNFKPEERKSIIPILIKNDYLYWLGCFLSNISFGYFTSLLVQETIKRVPKDFSSTVAMISAFVITVGVATGLQFSKLFEIFVLRFSF